MKSSYEFETLNLNREPIVMYLIFSNNKTKSDLASLIN